MREGFTRFAILQIFVSNFFDDFHRNLLEMGSTLIRFRHMGFPPPPPPIRCRAAHRGTLVIPLVRQGCQSNAAHVLGLNSSSRSGGGTTGWSQGI